MMGNGHNGFMDDEDADLAGLNDPQQDALPDSPQSPLHIPGGSGQPTVNESGEVTYAPAGREMASPLYAQAASNPACTQLRVLLYDDGQPNSLGLLDPKASEHDFIRKFITSMPTQPDESRRFGFRPVDMGGRQLGQEFGHVIHGSHQFLLRLRRAALAGSGAGASPAASPFGGVDPTYAALMKRQLDIEEARANRAEEERKLEYERLRKRDEDLSKAQVDLAMSSASGVQAITERMLSDDHRRQEQKAREDAERARLWQEQQAQFFATQTTLNKQGADTMVQMLASQREADARRWEEERKLRDQEYQMRLREEAEKRKAEREEVEARRKADMEELRLRAAEDRDRRAAEAAEANRRWQEEKAERERRAAAEEADRQRKHDREMAEIKAERERAREDADRRAAAEREHNTQMLQLQMETIKVRAGGAAGDIGATLAPLGNLAKSLGLGANLAEAAKAIFGGNSEGGTAGDIAGPIADVLQTAIKVFGEVAKARPAAAQQQTPPPMWAPGMPGMQAPIPQIPVNNLPPVNLQTGTAPQQTVPVGTPVDAAGQPVAQAAPAQPAAPAYGPGDIDPAKIDLPLETQKLARKAIRDCVDKLRRVDKDKWQDQAMLSIASEPAIYHYLGKTSIRYALLEGGATPEMAQQVIEMVDATGIVDNTVKRG